MKNQNWLRIVIIVLCIAMISIGLFTTGNYFAERFKTERRFTEGKEAPSQQIFDRIMSMDPETGYPASPEGVMDFFNDAFFLMYSNSIADDGTLFEVMARQRDVYSDELLILNPLELQFSQLKEDLEFLYEGGNICLHVERKGTVYDEAYPSESVVQTRIYYNTYRDLYRNYFLILDEDGRWRVNAWRATDENYSIIR